MLNWKMEPSLCSSFVFLLNSSSGFPAQALLALKTSHCPFAAC